LYGAASKPSWGVTVPNVQTSSTSHGSAVDARLFGWRRFSRSDGGSIHAGVAGGVAIQEYPLFDWLRFALASVVALAHLHLIQIPNVAHLAVQVFFALSGYLIGGILFQDNPKALPRFYFNRATRIWIPYLFAIIAAYGLSAFHQPITPVWLRSLAYDLTFTHQIFLRWPDLLRLFPFMPLGGVTQPFWSISVEEQFYLIAPLLIYAIGRFGRAPLLWASIFVVLLATQQTDFASISAGVCAASVQQRRPMWHTHHWWLIALSSGMILSFGGVLLVSPYNYVAPIFAICVVMLTAQSGTRGSLGRIAGGVSFPLYLNAWMGSFAANALAHYAIPRWESARLTLAYVLAVGIAVLIYFFIDRNVLARRASFYSPRLGKVLGVCAYGAVASGLVLGFFLFRGSY
jgi:peptidoglycan/LPS O-acetylase OafA/YrhL